MTFAPKNILVTGGAGFIGSNFIHYLLKNTKPACVINLDCLTYAGNLKNLSSLPAFDGYFFYQGNIDDRKLVETLLSKHQIDTIIHFAAESHVDRSIAHPSAFIETNINGTFVLLESAYHYWKETVSLNDAHCRFHHVSTDEVYGSLGLNDAAFTETTAYDPRSPYSASKAASDHLVRSYYHTYKLPITLSNCSNNYGPYQHAEKFIPTIIHACEKQAAIPIYGSGDNIRDWLYVDDHCDALWTILTKGETGETYNIGGNNEQTNLNLVKKLCAAFDKRFPEKAPHEKLLTFVTDRLGHDKRYAIDNRKILDELGWQPETSFEAGLEKTLDYYLTGNFSA